MRRHRRTRPPSDSLNQLAALRGSRRLLSPRRGPDHPERGAADPVWCTRSRHEAKAVRSSGENCRAQAAPIAAPPSSAMNPKSSGPRHPARWAATNGTSLAASASGSYAAIATKSQRRPKSFWAAERMRGADSRRDIDDFQRHDLVGFAAIDDEADRLLRDKRAVRLAFRVQRVAAR